MNKYNISYPNSFHDFSNGVDISNDRINKWIDDLLANADDLKIGEYVSRSSGNTKVVIYKMEDGLEVNVIKAYSESMIFNK